MISYKGGVVVRNRVNRLKRIISYIYKYDIASYFMKVPFSGPFRRFKKLNSVEDKPIQVRLRMMIEELGPTYVKIGQILSTQYDHLPKEFCDEFQKLQNNVAPFPSVIARGIIEEQLGRSISDMFAEFSEAPVASASLSQVHKARLKSGELVAVKVQRPGIEAVIRQDFDLLLYLCGYFDKHIRRKMKLDIKDILEESRAVILEEIDFRKELRNIEMFYANNKDDKKVKVPKVFNDYSSEKVLTMEFIDGVKITDLEGIRRMGLDSQEVMKEFIRAMYRQMLVHGLYHGDPHPANVLVLKDGSLAFLDFGVMGFLDDNFKNGYLEQTRALVKGDSREYVRRYAKTHGYPITEAEIDWFEEKVDIMMLDFFEGNFKSYGEFIFSLTTLMSESIPIPHSVAVFVRSLMATSSIMKIHKVSNKSTLLLFMEAHYEKPENRSELVKEARSSGMGGGGGFSLKTLLDPFGFWEGLFFGQPRSGSQEEAQRPVAKEETVSRVLPDDTDPARSTMPADAYEADEILSREEVHSHALDTGKGILADEMFDDALYEGDGSEVMTSELHKSIDENNREIDSILDELAKLNSKLR